jgi:hypothetical protein
MSFQHHTVTLMVVLAIAGNAAIALFWYLVGIGIGIAHRGYNRVAPYKVRRVIEQPRTPPPTHGWNDWKTRV